MVTGLCDNRNSYPPLNELVETPSIDRRPEMSDKRADDAHRRIAGIMVEMMHDYIR